MGNLCGGPEDPEAVEAKNRSRQIDAILKDDRAAVNKSLRDQKVLLLGTGDSGKTTVLKQIRLSYGVGFTDIEIVEFRSALLMNAIMCGKFLVYAMKSLKIPYGSAELPNQTATTTTTGGDAADALSSDALAEKGEDNELPASAVRIRDVNNIYGFTKNDSIPPDLVEDLLQVWNDPGVKYCFTRRNEYQLLECCEYVMSNLKRITQPNFIPTVEDILHTRLVTTNVTQTKVKIDNKPCIIFDVGGQKSQRKKWASFFEGVQAIIFIVSISAYDQVCLEDHSLNRMVDSLNVFKSVLSMKIFEKTGIVLFMNKMDVFKEKLTRSKISDYFPDFKGVNNFEEGSGFFIGKFQGLNQQQGREIHIHLTLAIDSEQLNGVMRAVFYLIFMANMKQSDLL
ncbi:Guanine nucleotide-binding protein G(i) subunit alpha-2 [Entophlyctis luteolus]|nr:Guanine nucleotide-binding protein G(i) subunit alpha-2 [Entophlyctis luteolus]